MTPPPVHHLPRTTNHPESDMTTPTNTDRGLAAISGYREAATTPTHEPTALLVTLQDGEPMRNALAMEAVNYALNRLDDLTPRAAEDATVLPIGMTAVVSDAIGPAWVAGLLVPLDGDTVDTVCGLMVDLGMDGVQVTQVDAAVEGDIVSDWIGDLIELVRDEGAIAAEEAAAERAAEEADAYWAW